jgi:hypothetical protein
MSDTRGFSVHYPSLETVRQSLLDTHASLAATVQDTQGGNTALADAYPAWATSAVLARLQAAHAEKINGHAQELAGYAIRVQLSMDNYRDADNASQGSIDVVGRDA